MPDPLIVTPTEVASYVNRSFSEDETAFVALVTRALQGQLEMRLNRPLAIRAITETHLVPHEQNRLFLNCTPVVSVASITIEGNALDPGAYLVNPWGEVDMSVFFTRSYDWYAIGEAQLVANYTAGIDGVNYPGIKMVLMQVVAREYLARANDTQFIKRLSVEGMRLDFGDGGLQGFQDDDLKALSRLRKRVVAF